MRPASSSLALAVLAALSAGCTQNNNGQFPGANPPAVTLGVPDVDHYGTTFRISVSVSGCDQVSAVGLYGNGGTTFYERLNFIQSPTVFDLTPQQLPYTSVGPNNKLSLVAKAFCSDGRVGASDPAAASFFPVADVLAAFGGASQLLPDTFWAEGTGYATTFLGCAKDLAGRPYLVKVGTTGSAVATNTNLPFPCTANSQFSDRSPVTGNRWMYDPGDSSSGTTGGVMELDPNLNVKAWATGFIGYLTLGPDGDAIAYDQKLIGVTVKRFRHNGGSNPATVLGWSHPGAGTMIAPPVVNPDASIYLAWYVPSGASFSGTISTERIDYRSGAQTAFYQLKTVSVDPNGPSRVPAAAFSPSGTILYVAELLAGTQSDVIACATNIGTCNTTVSGSQKWLSPTLQGYVRLLLPYADGSRIATITSAHSYFLRSDSGAQAGLPVDASGALVPYAVQQGLGRDFYILNGPATGGSGPTEIIALDSAEAGEVYRYTMLNGSLSIGIGDDDQAWLRINGDMVRPYPLTEYRLVAP